MRSRPEWSGGTDDASVPPRVRLRIFDAFDGRCQCGCGRKIRPGERWEPDHKIALINGGLHAESNLRPMLTEHHRAKTKLDVATKSRTYRKRKAHVGPKPDRTIRAWRKFDGSPVYADRKR